MSVGNMIEQIQNDFGGLALEIVNDREELTLVIKKKDAIDVLLSLNESYQFNQLIDICGVDYASYGQSDWKTDSATATGFSRGSMHQADSFSVTQHGCRFGVSYHLLSLSLNARIRVRVMLKEDDLIVPTALNIWPSAEWAEREVFDMYGVLFDGHPDLRRVLTDYGFIGHPFRKDFPVSGHVEMRYDENLKRVVYGPVEIEPRINVARVIRKDNRYADLSQEGEK
jgi:NADH-quinone oxidoreductase subunit C